MVRTQTNRRTFICNWGRGKKRIIENERKPRLVYTGQGRNIRNKRARHFVEGTKENTLFTVHGSTLYCWNGNGRDVEKKKKERKEPITTRGERERVLRIPVRIPIGRRLWSKRRREPVKFNRYWKSLWGDGGNFFFLFKHDVTVCVRVLHVVVAETTTKISTTKLFLKCTRAVASAWPRIENQNSLSPAVIITSNESR